MLRHYIYSKILKRSYFKGQDRIFSFLFKNKQLQVGNKIVKPLAGDFKIKCDTNTWIGAKIVYTGDYESFLKKVFKDHIKVGDKILDVGANIGFHSLYFSELVGVKGSVISFEPVPVNFKKLTYNIELNGFKNITPKNIALGNKNEQLSISADEESNNPGSYNLFNQDGNVLINCFIGDEIIEDQKIDFIKIDVEGYENFVIDGLIKTINRDRPKIVFEYDSNYYQKTNLPVDFIFALLKPLNYVFFEISIQGLIEIKETINVKSANILAIQK